ncbi:oligosaccharide flippase family protein [Spirosoma taeanense]|uniref:Oligosaccharide flippase family protein n=1 Tax=Spirosoma taeanense TaxID=2735870 RepID=A0A6M5Y623_9BACT|nr:polysaccharide biosynthesis C-terminal domain-containing protein [Spirosoma taeanense]QJW88503.1 oligosaccharide flippase family protein [Spirosoma taeanense]
MLTKHSIIYFLGRGMPGLINFLALSIYTRLVLPEEYGSYALIVATVNLFNAVLFQWIRLVLLRYTPTCTSEDDKRQLNTTVLAGYLGSILLSAVLIGLFLYISGQKIPISYISLGVGLLFVQAFFEIGLDYYRSNLQPKQYSFAHFLKATLAIGLSSALAYFGYGATGLLLGLLIASFAAIAFYFKSFFTELTAKTGSFDSRAIRTHLTYGVPLTASSALTFIMDSSDRYLVKHFLGTASTGTYSVGYDLAKQTLWVIMISISLASYPLVIRALEHEGPAAANKHLKSNLILLLAISLPTAIGMAALAPQIAFVLVGEKYADTVAMLIPYIAIGAVLSGIKSFYLDQSFQLAQKTRLQLWSVGVAAFINVALNLLLLPRIGLMGAAYATLISYGAVLLLSYMLSLRAYKLPIPWEEILKILTASILMGAVILLFRSYGSGLWGLLFLTLLGGILYGSLLIAFKVISISFVTNQLKLKSKKNYA